LAKYISIPHSGIKLQKLCSDQKTNNTIEFLASNYPKMIVSTLPSDSSTSKPKINFVSVSVPYNLQLMPRKCLENYASSYRRAPLPRALADFNFQIKMAGGVNNGVVWPIGWQSYS
jgi:hypothetical protein